MLNKQLLKKIRKLPCRKEWGKRESAAVEIKKLNDRFFKEYYPVWKKWTKDQNPNVRRAIEVGLLRINKKYVKNALMLLKPLLYDDNSYVRKNCGPFSLSHICYKDPTLGFKKIEEWMKIDNVNVKWNIAMCLGAWFGLKYPDKSIKLLKTLAKDKRRFVWRAASSSLIKILRKHPKYKKEVYSWKNMNSIIETVKKYVGR